MAQIDAEQAEIELTIADIKGQIDLAERTYHDTGERADPQWFGRAKSALRYYGIRHQALLRERRRRRLAEHADRPMSDYFMDAAREILPEETFVRIWNHASQVKRGSDGLRGGPAG